MHWAILYLDTSHRILIYTEGGYSLEKYVTGIGWCLEADETAWPGEPAAFRELGELCLKHAANYPAGRIETGPEEYDATHEAPPVG